MGSGTQSDRRGSSRRGALARLFGVATDACFASVGCTPLFAAAVVTAHRPRAEQLR
jgi:hypothetical protein